MKKIKLLSPAGSLPNLKAAVAGGADAVYLGLSKFNAREYATNFNQEYLKEAVRICKSNNVRLYVAMNTLVKNSEINEFLEQIKQAYEKGIDAVIIQDPGFISIIKKNFPNLEIHMSTQAGIMNSKHANLFSNIESINLARELDKKNIELIRKNYKKELEIFVHGALCASISGSCLFSSLLGGRSGNRGKCAQPCRKLYNQSFLLSTKELCLVDKIPEIIKVGINALKIEGRMRTPYYTYTATSVYRKAIDSFYVRNAHQFCISEHPKNPTNKQQGFFDDGKFSVTEQMRKELQSAFSREFTEGKFSNDFCFNPKQASGSSNIKETFYKVKTAHVKIEKRKGSKKIPEIKIKESSGKKLIARVYNQKDALDAEKYADIICLDMFNKDFENLHENIKKPLYAVTPRIMFDTDIENIEERIKQISPDGLVAGNLGILNIGFNLPIILDYNSNCFNDIQLGYYESMKAKPIISPELSIKELKEFKNKDFIVLIHGKIRLMTLAHDFPEKTLVDEKGFDFNLRKIPNGTEILNGKEIGLFNKSRDLLKAGINQIYVDTENNTEEILKIYREILDGKTPDASKLQKQYVLGWSKMGVL